MGKRSVAAWNERKSPRKSEKVMGRKRKCEKNSEGGRQKSCERNYKGVGGNKTTLGLYHKIQQIFDGKTKII